MGHSTQMTMYSFTILDRLYLVIMFGVTHTSMIGSGTEGLTTEHRMEHHTWTRAMSDRECACSNSLPHTHTHTQIYAHKLLCTLTYTHPHTSVPYALTHNQHKSFYLTIQMRCIKNAYSPRALKANDSQNFEQG